MDKKSALIATVTLMLLLSLAFGLQMVSANPIPVSPIRVNSPENNKIYNSNQVELNFTVLDTYRNFTSFSYSLDGQEPIATNQSCVLTNLPSGDHTLTIYGNSTEHNYWNGHELLSIVYFSTIYSTAWLTFALILTASLAILVPLLFFGRNRIANRLKRKKEPSFWLGLLFFLFSTLVFSLAVLIWADNLLFPSYTKELYISYPMFDIVVSIPFMILGYFLMWIGTKKAKEPLR